MPTVTAYATPAAKAPFERTTIERREVGPKDVRIKVAFCGICHSDIHTGRGEWGETNYPLVPGHEIAGVVEEVGSDVSKFKVGEHAGVGCMVSSCGHCEQCTNGEEQFCTDGGMVGTYGGELDGKPTDGGYSAEIVVDENYVLHIPDGISLDEAAPLLCAGITLYSPLNHFGAGPGKNVAIVGMGGLGHMGVKIAHAMGAEVTVLSQTTAKEEDGKKFGADHYYATKDGDTFKKLRGSFDLIVNTVSAQLPMQRYLSLLKPRGAMVNVGAPSEPMEVPAFALIGGGKTWAGSQIGGIKETQEMLDFCAEHNIGATIETIRPDKIDEAWDRVVDSDVRYRFVIDTSTFDD
ncbi:NAD(P)-dependent alcohol dehydrogenase [uncultured Jatrophihabitans sp.]|uniref:NAD(P)-dependent alcohol dehydrogenase n=1 Tax=uncultured Jatrophihabitans sp. TaxID=1610747 RepID=UPI0035CBDBFF